MATSSSSRTKLLLPSTMTGTVLSVPMFCVKILAAVWPYIDREIKPIELSPLKDKDRMQTVQDRNPLAAPGLDGWRTTDLQKLPRPAAKQLHSSSTGSSLIATRPSQKFSLTRAKQVILNKPGPSTPLNKRLITILSPLLLAYAGTRFRQLPEWQRTTLPAQLCGGIKVETWNVSQLVCAWSSIKQVLTMST